MPAEEVCSESKDNGRSLGMKRQSRLMYQTEIQMASITIKLGESTCLQIFVIRIPGIGGVSPKVHKVLQLLHLHQIFHCTCVELNEVSINVLRIVEPYLNGGTPT